MPLRAKRVRELASLTRVANERFAEYLEILGGTPPHRVEFSPRISTSWALIYYRRHLVRLSPYLFLLSQHELKHASHWQELDATLRHEAAHAALFARTGEPGHTREFHRLLRQIGVDANGGCDLGPESVAYRYLYACPTCSRPWSRRTPLRGKWSCGACSPGRFTPEHAMLLMADMGHPIARLRACADVVAATMDEALSAPRSVAPLARVR